MTHANEEEKDKKKVSESLKRDSDNEAVIEIPDKFRVSTTHHTVTIGGVPVRYIARAGMYKILDEKGKHKYHIFFISYEKDIPEKEKETRPITFAFNGGPGASSIWVHFGAMGPRRVKMTDDGRALPPPHQFEDNFYSWLDFTDLVFIDPVGTGFSGFAEGIDPKQFYGVKEDIVSVGDFIRLYITKHQRWLSPKFVAGESYGTTRAAGLAGHLQEKLGIDLSGIVLISSVLDGVTQDFVPGNDLPFAMFLPSYASTAWYHKKLSPRLQENLLKTFEEVENWTLEEYLPALAMGNTLPPERYEKVAEKLAEYTGVSIDYIKHANLRVCDHRFMKELLRDERRTTGRLDSRAKGIDADAAGEFPEYDPTFPEGPFVATINDYVRDELKYKNEHPYVFMGKNIIKEWNWQSINKLGFTSVTDVLRSAIHQNRYLQVLITCGYFDLCTPYFSALYSVNHMKLDPSLRDNITITFYDAGHMVYYPLDMLRKFKMDIATFYHKTTNQEYRP